MDVRNLSRDICRQLAECVTHPLYRGMQVLHICFSVVGFSLLAYLLWMIRKRLSFHYNMKILFVSLVVACMFHSLWITIFQCHHLILSFSFEDDCDVVLDPVLYRLFNIPLVGCVLWFEATQVLMFVERTVATLFYRCYERSGRHLGNSLLFLSVFLPVLGCFVIFYGKETDEPQISALNTPSSSASSITTLFVSLTLLNLVAVIASVILYIVNRKKSAIINDSLTAKYQKAENAVSARFMAAITTGTLIIFATYGSATALLRLSHDKTKVADVFYRSYIMMAYTIPLYTVILPLISFMGIRRMEIRRQNKVENLVQVQAAGEEGWQNYADQLRQQWGQ